MPTWITPRRLGIAAVLYATFAGGWYVGQPVSYDCTPKPEAARTAEPTAPEPPAPEPSPEPSDLAELPELPEPAKSGLPHMPLDDAYPSMARDVLVVTAVNCTSPTSRPRLSAWIHGDWR